MYRGTERLGNLLRAAHLLGVIAEVNNEILNEKYENAKA